MSLKEKISPTAESFTVQEISEDLNIPVEMIEKLRKVGVITPIGPNNDYYSYRTVKFLESYWPAVSHKMLNAE